MKLKNVLILAFGALTLIPIVIASLLLYQSGFNLSKESYTRNLAESINVQEDYISQTMENNMIENSRFVSHNSPLFSDIHNRKEDLLTAFQGYLEGSEDKVTACLLLDQGGNPIYTIGEKAVLDKLASQLSKIPKSNEQKIMEFEFEKGAYSLGIITPIWNHSTYAGSLVSIYDKSYIFKIISSYYKVSNTSIYLCRKNGDIMALRKFADEKQNTAIEQVLYEKTFDEKGIIDYQINGVPVSGYYKNIHNSPWYLVGFTDHKLIYSFVNQFIWFYILIIFGVLITALLLSFYFSRKVVAPINALIQVMDQYQNDLNYKELQAADKTGYFETQYLHAKFISLMKTILLVQHNFKGIYQLYQSSDMGDTNIDIDVKKQTVVSSKESFRDLMQHLNVLPEDCIVERFIKCFCEKDQHLLRSIFENMRDEHLSVTSEAEIYTPHLNKKWFHILVVPMYEDDRLSRLFIQLRDISNFKKQEFHSIEQARKDALTGLYNRLGFTNLVKEILQTENKSGLHCLLFIDMNYFKLVNDNFGHSAGDDLLRRVGEILLEAAGSDDIVSRFGGDEFAVFLPHISLKDIEIIKTTLNERLVFPFQSENISFTVSASIGISTWSAAAPNTLEKLLELADKSMYQAKRDFKANTDGTIL